MHSATPSQPSPEDEWAMNWLGSLEKGTDPSAAVPPPDLALNVGRSGKSRVPTLVKASAVIIMLAGIAGIANNLFATVRLATSAIPTNAIIPVLIIPFNCFIVFLGKGLWDGRKW